MSVRPTYVKYVQRRSMPGFGTGKDIVTSVLVWASKKVEKQDRITTAMSAFPTDHIDGFLGSE